MEKRKQIHKKFRSINKNKLMILIYFLVSLYFLNTFVNGHFHFNFTPSYVSVFFYVALTLVCFLISSRTKIVAIQLGIFFGITIVVFFKSSTMAQSIAAYNKEIIESNPARISYVYYGIYPSKAKFNADKKEIEIRGLYGVRKVFQVEKGRWLTID